MAALRQALATCPPESSIARFLADHPVHRNAVRRVQNTVRHDYAEVRDNTVAATMLPIDLLRAKLSFFGATRFDPRSDRWVRITMFNNAPFPDEIHDMEGDTWMYGVGTAAPAVAVPKVSSDACGTPIRNRAIETVERTGWSMSEISALSAKATRGAGLPWGIAAEAARAVRDLCEMGLPGAEALALDLERDLPGSTLMLGCCIADAGKTLWPEIAKTPVSVLLLMPFLRQTLSEGEGCRICTEDGAELAVLSADSAAIFAPSLETLQKIRVELCKPETTFRSHQRVDQIPEGALKALNNLAARTYAPATEASRLKGAGAGVLDND